MFQKPSTLSAAQNGSTPRKASSPLRSSIDVYSGVPETIQRQSQLSFSHARAWSVVLLRISCIVTSKSHVRNEGEGRGQTTHVRSEEARQGTAPAWERKGTCLHLFEHRAQRFRVWGLEFGIWEGKGRRLHLVEHHPRPADPVEYRAFVLRDARHMSALVSMGA
jgi:hypothetical protein